MNLPDFNLDVLRGPLDCSHPDVVALINQGESDPEGFLHALTRLVIKDNPQKYDLYTLLTQAIAGGASGPDTVGESAPSGSEGSISRWLFSLGRGKNQNEQALLSWGELREDIHRRMNVLAKQGVKPGDVVVLMGLGINSLLASVLAVLRLGGAFSVLSMQPSFTFQARKAALLALTQAPSSNPSHSSLSHSNLACLSSNHLSPCHSTIKRCFFLTETRLESASGDVLAHLPEKPEATLSTLVDNRPFTYNSTDTVCISFDEETVRMVLPGYISGNTQLFSRTSVQSVTPVAYGLAEWTIDALTKGQPEETKKQVEAILNRLYLTAQNKGQTADERALNYFVYNVINLSDIVIEAAKKNLQFSSYEVVPSKIQRHHSELRQVQLTFFNPANTNEASTTYATTMDVSGITPITVGKIESWQSPVSVAKL